MLELLNVINVSVSENPTGLGNYNVNNLALFSNEVPLANSESSSSSSSGGGSYNPGPYGIYRVYVSAAAVAADWGTDSETYQQAVAVFSQQPNILAGGGNLIIFPMSQTGSGETLLQAITRTIDVIFYAGIISTDYPLAAGMQALSDYVASLEDKILFLPSNLSANIAGIFTDIKDSSNHNTRCLYYSTNALDSRLFAAAYAGRGMSVDFTGSNTAITMNLKQLSTIDPDEGVTQTLYNSCQTAGVDVYVSYAGVSSAVSNGANRYFDEVYNLIWFVSQLKVTGFNALAQVGTKVPQTEPGMSLLKAAYRSVCEQAKNNGFIAPGRWTAAEWFGNQVDMINNILERGYYIYSLPVNQQSATDRADRKAPLVQIAIKESGAIQSSNVLVLVNP